jgi:hypothetical protein
MHSKLASDWELFVTRKQKNKEMKRLKRALFSRDADATAHCGGRSMDLRQPGGQQSSCATRDPDPCPQIAPVCESIRAADGTEVTESAGITTVFREHYKQRPTGVRRVRRGQLRPRDS